MTSRGNTTKHLRVNTYPSQKNSKILKRKNTFKLILWGHHYPDTKVRQGQYKIIRQLSLMDIDANFLNKILVNHSIVHSKGLNTIIKWGLSLGHKDGSTHANQYLWYTTLTKWINIVLSSQKMQEKTFYKIQHFFMIKLSTN